MRRVIDLFKRLRDGGSRPEGWVPSEHQGQAALDELGHRNYVGGLWDEMGRLQFDFLVSRGLKPHHRLLDIACGSLRAGIHFIEYLEPGHYLGMDKEAALIEAGLTQELDPRLVREKHPNLVVSGSFEFERFGERPDFALAQSLFTHLPPALIERCLANLGPVIQPDGRFFATFFESDRPVDNPDDPHDFGYFAYTRAEMEAFGAAHGWRAEYIGDWGHPRRQVMVCYRPRA